MTKRAGIFVATLCLSVSLASAQVHRVTDLNSRQIRALDRGHTAVVLTGGMLEEHGPYLPAGTDLYLSQHLADEVARAIAAKPGWHVLLFPVVSLGASGSNEIGGKFSWPGTYAVRPSTLRAEFMDIATELGEQGFRWVFIVHVHGAPLHNHALDEAGDYFHDAYGGRMVNLWTLLPVISGWGNAMRDLPDAVKKEDGDSLHAGMDETSMMLFLEPALVADDFKNAPVQAGENLEAAFARSKQPDWEGYLGSPRLGNRTLGEKIWRSFSAAACDTAIKIIDGADVSKMKRYADLLDPLPLYQAWMKTAAEHDRAIGRREEEWTKAKHSTAH